MRYLIVLDDDDETAALAAALDLPGRDRVLAVRGLGGSVGEVMAFRPEVLVVPRGVAASERQLVLDLARFGRCPVIALSPHEALDRAELGWAAAVCVAPYTVERVRRFARMTVPSSRRWEGDPLVLRCGVLEVREDERVALAGGQPIPLTFAEFELLDALIRRKGMPVSRSELGVFRDYASGRGRGIDVHIQRIRTKLRRTPGVTIETVKGIGYRLKLAEDVAQ